MKNLIKRVKQGALSLLIALLCTIVITSIAFAHHNTIVESANCNSGQGVWSSTGTYSGGSSDRLAIANGSVNGTSISGTWYFDNDSGHLGHKSSYTFWDLSGTGSVTSSGTLKLYQKVNGTYDMQNPVDTDTLSLNFNAASCAPTATRTSTPTRTSTVTKTVTPTSTTTHTATPSKTGSPTSTATSTASNTPTRTASPTATSSPTYTITPTKTYTPTPTATTETIKVPVCHADGGSGKYSYIVVSIHSVDDANGVNGHGTHSGDIWDSYVYGGVTYAGQGDMSQFVNGTCDTPTATPTTAPTKTNTPTVTPSYTPTDTPTNTPTLVPSDTPTNTPTVEPSDTPTNTPTVEPSDTPTITPETPTATPSNTPTDEPTLTPTPTEVTVTPSNTPTDGPTITPTPTDDPTITPTPTDGPTITPTPTTPTKNNFSWSDPSTCAGYQLVIHASTGGVVTSDKPLSGTWPQNGKVTIHITVTWPTGTPLQVEQDITLHRPQTCNPTPTPTVVPQHNSASAKISCIEETGWAVEITASDGATYPTPPSGLWINTPDDTAPAGHLTVSWQTGTPKRVNVSWKALKKGECVTPKPPKKYTETCPACGGYISEVAKTKDDIVTVRYAAGTCTPDAHNWCLRITDQKLYARSLHPYQISGATQPIQFVGSDGQTYYILDTTIWQEPVPQRKSAEQVVRPINVPDGGYYILGLNPDSQAFDEHYWEVWGWNTVLKFVSCSRTVGPWDFNAQGVAYRPLYVARWNRDHPNDKIVGGFGGATDSDWVNYLISKEIGMSYTDAIAWLKKFYADGTNTLP